jgi:hypothetical protein
MILHLLEYTKVLFFFFAHQAFLAPFHPLIPTPVPNPPNPSPAKGRGGAAAEALGGPGFVGCWNEDRKDDVGTDWIERNLLTGGRSSLLYYEMIIQLLEI